MEDNIKMESGNFIKTIIIEDINKGKLNGMRAHLRFPPEPNGYLHIGHAKAICLNFSLAKEFNGLCNLRMDDTNPTKEDEEYVNSIKDDIKWLGFNWNGRVRYASEYFEQMYNYAVELIKKGLAYVCNLTPEQIKMNRGDLNVPAVSPCRDRSVEESLDLFRKMKEGQFEDGKYTLRAKIDLSSGNFNMRDPVIYRISRKKHHATGNKWLVYPMYDFAHPLEDMIEGITHSLCTLEFEEHRPLYNWFINNITFTCKPRQIEFARLNLDHTVMSKRKLLRLVEETYVDGWDDPRMPTICGLRRRGYTPESIRNFCEKIGISKVNSVVDYRFLEHCLREDLNKNAYRVMAVINPVRLIITNYPKSKNELFEIENNPNKKEDGKRNISFSRELYIERDDFEENPPKKFFRLYPGNEVRLKSAYIIKCTGCKKDNNGKITEVYAEYYYDTKGGKTPDGRKVKSTIHWVDKKTAISASVNLYDDLFLVNNPEDGKKDFIDYINKDSLKVLKDCKVEKFLFENKQLKHFQFLRLGYFCLDKNSKPGDLIFNRTVSLKDSYKPNKKSKD